MARGARYAWLLTLLLTGQATAEPSRAFIQELGQVAAPRSVHLDLYNSTGTWSRRAESQLRVGSHLGELSASLNYLGFKALLRSHLAAYANLGLATSPSQLHVNAGVAYTRSSRRMMININPEYAKTSGGKGLLLNGALFFPVRSPAWLGRLHLGGEASLPDSSDLPLGLALGLRWLPRQDLTVDVVLAADGGSLGNGAIATPAALRINLAL